MAQGLFLPVPSLLTLSVAGSVTTVGTAVPPAFSEGMMPRESVMGVSSLQDDGPATHSAPHLSIHDPATSIGVFLSLAVGMVAKRKTRDPLEQALGLMENLDHKNPRVASSSLTRLRKLLPGLSASQNQTLLSRLKGRYQTDKDYSSGGLELLGELLQRIEDPQEKLACLRLLARNARREWIGDLVCRQLDGLLDQISPSWVHLLIDDLLGERKYELQSADRHMYLLMSVMSSLIPRVAEEHVMGVVLKLRALEKQCDRMFPEDCVIVDGLRKDGFGAFTVAQKLQIIAHLIEAGFEEPTAADEIDFWIRQIPAGARKSLSSSHHSEAVRRFAILAQSDLPLDVPGLLDRFMASPDPEEFIEDLNQKADPFRRGQDVDVNDPEQMLLGYVAMDRPSPSQENFDHSAWSWSLYERSMKGSVHDHWLPPYWTEGFRFTLPVQASAHEKINKGKLGEWISEMTSAADPTKIRQTLIDLVRKPPKALRASIEAWFASYRPQKGNYLETDLIRLLTRKTDDLAALLGEVIPILKSADTRGDGRINHAIAQFLFAIAFHSPRHRQARLAFLEASRNLSHKSVPGTELLAALGAARALLGDPVNEAAAAMGLKVPAAWMKMREALDDEAARASVTTQASVEVEIVPTKCRTDRFFGYVGEDCTKADASWLGKPNFQLARMIVNGRLDGMVYMQRNYFEGTKDWVLTIEPTPRERLKVDHDALLSGIERGFSAAAKKLGNYRYVVLSAAELEQGNRVDMHAAIRRRKYPKMMIKRRSSSFYDSEESYVLFDRDAGS